MQENSNPINTPINVLFIVVCICTWSLQRITFFIVTKIHEIEYEIYLDPPTAIAIK